jgi:hypothetical protein
MSNASDKLLDEYLNGNSPYAERYRSVESYDVPGELDRAVLDEAQRSVSKRKPQLWWRVGPALAIAATAVLTITIVMRSGEQSFEPVVARDDVTDQAKQKAQPQSGEERAKEPVAFAKVEAPAAAAPKVVSQDQPRLAQTKIAETDKLKKAIVAEEKQSEVSRGLLAPAPQMQSAPAASASSVEAEKVASREQSAPASPASPATANASAADTRRDATLKQRARQENAELNEVIVTSSLRRTSPQDTAAPVSVFSAPDVFQNDPLAWLKYIRQLRHDGKNDEADEHFKLFVETFPKYVIGKNDPARPKKK